MIKITPQMRILVAVPPVDFRRGIDGLSRMVREELNRDSFSGCVFVFRNRMRTSLKILVYDGQGFWLCQKRLSEGRLRWWPKGDEASQVLSTGELHTLLWNGNPATAQVAPDWSKVE
jgi:transposase